MREWQYDYVGHLHPDLETHHWEAHAEALKSTDYETPEAKAFKAGWELATKVAIKKLFVAQRELEHKLGSNTYTRGT